MSELKTANYKHITFTKWENMFGDTYWRCHTKKQIPLGTVERGQYGWEFVPNPNTAYTTDCLADIIDFINKVKAMVK